MEFLLWLLIGALAGFLAGRVMRGGGFGLLINILVGIAGGWLGGSVLGWFNIVFFGHIGYLITAFLGACLLLWIISLFKK